MGLTKDQIREHIANIEKRLCSDKEVSNILVSGNTTLSGSYKET